MIQHLEGALSVAITLKRDIRYPSRITKKEADNFLKKYRLITLGRAINLAKQSTNYSETLYNDLEELLKERNWLVHKLMIDHLDDMNVPQKRENLFQRIKAISNKSNTLQKTIEADLIKFSESVGLDMSRIRPYVI